MSIKQRVLLHEAGRFRFDPTFHATLLAWAANARRRLQVAATLPMQQELFT